METPKLMQGTSKPLCSAPLNLQVKQREQKVSLPNSRRGSCLQSIPLCYDLYRILSNDVTTPLLKKVDLLL